MKKANTENLQYWSYMESDYPDVRLTGENFVDYHQTGTDPATTWLETHENLIFALAHQYAPTRDDVEDFYQEICLAIWSAFGTYDDHRVDVLDTTYYWHVGENRCLEILRSQNAKKRNGKQTICAGVFVDFDHVIYQNPAQDDDMTMVYREIHNCVESAEESHIKNDQYSILMKGIRKDAGLTDSEYAVTAMIANGYTQMYIAKEMGIAQSVVNYRLNKARTKLRKYMKEVA